MGITAVLSLFLLFLALAMWLWSRRIRRRTGLPAGSVIYTDAGAWFRNDESLVAPDVQLVGKPDYLVEERDGAIVPVEVKSGKAPTQPYESHLLQLAAYCYLVDVTYGIRPSHGIIQYRDRAFAVDYTPALEDDLLDLLADMRETMFAYDVDRDHEDWRRCARCGLRGDCEQRLA